MPIIKEIDLVMVSLWQLFNICIQYYQLSSIKPKHNHVVCVIRLVPSQIMVVVCIWHTMRGYSKDGDDDMSRYDEDLFCLIVISISIIHSSFTFIVISYHGSCKIEADLLLLLLSLWPSTPWISLPISIHHPITDECCIMK